MKCFRWKQQTWGHNMKIGIINHYNIYNKNDSVFNPDTYTIGDNLGCGSIKLKEKLNKLGHEIHTMDNKNIDEYDKFIFNDYPSQFPPEMLIDLKNKVKQLYLILWENQYMKPDNYYNHDIFDKVFTWDNNLLTSDKYIKIYHPQVIKELKIIPKKEKLACMISSGKYVNIHNNLYFERIKVIDMYEKIYTDKNNFDYYGKGWNESINYKGEVKRKSDVIGKYQFAYTFENSYGLNGYVTEKIFDALLNGTVPIYWGAGNIKDEIPEGCYILINQKPTKELNYSLHMEMYNELVNMPDKKYNEYLSNIVEYVNGKDIQKYSDDKFADTIIENINVNN
jgi:alpha(1,3/1,4) fucosyltransferase